MLACLLIMRQNPLNKHTNPPFWDENCSCLERERRYKYYFINVKRSLINVSVFHFISQWSILMIYDYLIQIQWSKKICSVHFTSHLKALYVDVVFCHFIWCKSIKKTWNMNDRNLRAFKCKRNETRTCNILRCMFMLSNEYLKIKWRVWIVKDKNEYRRRYIAHTILFISHWVFTSMK